MHCSAKFHEQPLWNWKTTMSKFDIKNNKLMIEVRLTLYRFDFDSHFFRTFFLDKKSILNKHLQLSPHFSGWITRWPPMLYPRCDANVILDQTTLRRCLCSSEMPNKKSGDEDFWIMGLEYLPTFGLNSWDQCNYSSPMERFGGWWLSHQNLKKKHMPVQQRTFEKDQSIQLNAIHRNRWDMPTLHGISQSQRIHSRDWYIYLLIHQKKSTTWSHVAKHKIHGSYGNVKKKPTTLLSIVSTFPSNPPKHKFDSEAENLFRTVRPHVEPRNR